jgi:hypothetical protein
MLAFISNALSSPFVFGLDSVNRSLSWVGDDRVVDFVVIKEVYSALGCQ